MMRGYYYERDIAKETVHTTPNRAKLFNILDTSEAQHLMEFQEDMDEIEDDNDDASLVSSRAGSVGGSVRGEEDVDDENEELEPGSEAASAVKKLGNVRRKPMNKKLIFKDLLGESADFVLRNVKEKHLKMKQRRELQLKMMAISNRHWEIKMRDRMVSLEAKKRQSKSKTFTRHNHTWKSQFKRIMKEERNEAVRRGI
jgi:hypothetical protein